MIGRKDILSALGAEVREDNFITGMLVGIGIGAVCGGALALLFAPKTGPEMRHLLGERSSQLVEKAKTKIGIGNGGRTSVETTKPPGSSY